MNHANKNLYQIGEVTKMLGVTRRMLLNYEDLGTAEALSMFQQLIMNQLLLVFIKVAVHTTKLILYKLNILMKLLIFHVIEICN